MWIGLDQLPLCSLFLYMLFAIPLMPVAWTQMRCPKFNKRKTVSLSVSYKLVSPCSSTSQESAPPSSRPRTRTLESLLERKPSDFWSHLLSASLFSSSQDYISVKPMRISPDQMTKLNQITGSSPRRPCQWCTSSSLGCGISPLSSLTS